MTDPAAKNKPTTRINLELPADLDAVYANLALISHSPSEIFIDLARVMPNVPKTKIRSRIVMTPLNAKLLHRALTDSLAKFEAKYGEITVPENVAIDPNKGFVK
jgi:hypothetical protein